MQQAEPATPPLFVVALGRSGTTMLMRALAAHPQIIAFSQYPLELRVWTHVAHRGDASLVSGLLAHEDRLAWPQGVLSRLRSVGHLTARDAMQIYDDLAEEAGKTSPHLAAEKYPPRLDLQEALRVVPRARAVLLVRDPRDVIASARRFDAKRGYRGFLERDGDGDDVLLEKYGDAYARLAQWRRALGAPLVRYEDLVAEPDRTLDALFEALGLDHGAAIVEAARGGWDVKARRHRTASSAEESVGSWRGAVSDDFAGRLMDLTGAHLRDLGYGSEVSGENEAC